MKIERLQTIVTCPGRNFVTVKIVTDEGVYGLGDATLNGRELAVRAYLEDHVFPCLVGRDPRNIEDIWQYLYRGAYWRRGPVTMTAIAAIDMALWDIKGKLANMPVYQLLGGKSREGLMVYGHANGRDHEEAIDAVRQHVEEGYQAIRVQSGVPGLDKVYGVGKVKGEYEPAQKGLPPEEPWDTALYLRHTPELFRKVREAVGFGPHLLHDAHHRLTPIEAARLGRDLEPYRLFWLEDATPAENQESFRLIRSHTSTPLAVGEVFNSIWDCKDLIREQLIDYIRATIVHAGGITHMRRIADYAAMYQVRTGFHGATDLSPVCMAAAVNFGLWAPNFGIQELMPHNALTNAVFPHQYRFENGFLVMDDAPGLGVDIDETLAAKYPYERAYLPVARLRDGSMWNW
ncbi:D-mannonate dehydratase ManD [Paraburkholderia sp. EG287A]|uniref:D-galactonate dehydratase family protein n=2 Tax=Paraburkholderia TaxID=1822464 RepID=A0A4R5LJY1_9BURK|nr:D-mannonate dehydratase ManD [Paraburkholderia guartelaensis]TDG09844.1 D-galactonate dehydratase family protein [Paraburkholderia guartelaensis]